jgi:hypothetical protein
MTDTFDIKMTATFVGERTENGWEHNRWDVLLERNGETMSVPYKMGLGLTTKGRWIKPRPPELTEVLSSLTMDARCDLWDEYDELFGGEPYSKVREIEAACKRTVLDLRRLLGRDFDRFIETQWED